MITSIKDLIELVGIKSSSDIDLNKPIRKYAIRAWDCAPNSVFMPRGRMAVSAYSRAVSRGAIVCLYDDPKLSIPNGVLVENVAEAGNILANAGRSAFNGKTIAITGSAGKSTLKSMLVGALSTNASVQSTFKNQNLPEYVTAQAAMMKDTADYFVVETALRQKDTVAISAAMIDPNIAVITNISSNHAENFDPLIPIEDQILAAKCKLFDAPSIKVAVLPSGSIHFKQMKIELEARQKPIKMISCGQRPEDTVKLVSCVQHMDTSDVEIEVAGKRFSYRVPLPGFHMVENSLLVAGVLHSCEVPIETMGALSSLKNLPHSANKRYRVDFDNKTVEIIAEVFNMGSSNFKSLMESVQTRNDKGRKVLVMSDCGETGTLGEEIHRIFGEQIMQTEFAHIITVGKLSGHMAKQLPIEHTACNDFSEVFKILQNVSRDNDLIVIKGSSALGFPKIINTISQNTKMTIALSNWHRGLN